MAGMYASETSVTVEKSQAEIRALLIRYGAEAYYYFEKGSNTIIGFEFHSLPFRINVPLPDKKAKRFTHTDTGKERKPQQAHKEWEKGCRQVWRAAALFIKGSLEAVEGGFINVERAFLPFLHLNDGRVLGDVVMEDPGKVASLAKLLPPGVGER